MLKFFKPIVQALFYYILKFVLHDNFFKFTCKVLEGLDTALMSSATSGTGVIILAILAIISALNGLLIKFLMLCTILLSILPLYLALIMLLFFVVNGIFLLSSVTKAYDHDYDELMYFESKYNVIFIPVVKDPSECYVMFRTKGDEIFFKLSENCNLRK